jgi:predicted dehydrogenase
MTQIPDLTVGVIGIDHRHIYGMLEGMISAGAQCVGWWTEGEPATLGGFVKRFPDVPRHQDRRRIMENPDISLVLISAPPAERAALAIEAMRHGKDVMVDKPGCITLAELDDISRVARETGRIWSVDFSERFEVPATLKALELVRQGAIGQVVHTTSLGPHRLNRATRPDWFFDRDQYGGILGDIGTHQIDQFLTFTGSEDVEIVSASVGNFANPGDPKFQDFGELMMRSDKARGYARVDWYTPDGLANWGDGRLFLLGTDGYIELRKYVDVAGRPGTDHLFIVDGKETRHIDCSDVKLTYFADLAADVKNRTETAMTLDHAVKVSRRAIEAQLLAEKSR